MLLSIGEGSERGKIGEGKCGIRVRVRVRLRVRVRARVTG